MKRTILAAIIAIVMCVGCATKFPISFDTGPVSGGADLTQDGASVTIALNWGWISRPIFYIGCYVFSYIGMCEQTDGNGVPVPIVPIAVDPVSV